VERAQEYRLLAERLRGLAGRANLPEAEAELLWLAKSYERLAGQSAEGLLMQGPLGLGRLPSENADCAVAD
jgi:hypothetical protein